MMNDINLIGRIVNDLEVVTLENDTKVSNIVLAVDRTFKNSNGEVETDFIDCTLWNKQAVNTAEYCKKGDLIRISGRLQTGSYEKEGQKHKTVKVIGEKVSFLQNKDRSKSSQNRDER